jgi:hypothetical protein
LKCKETVHQLSVTVKEAYDSFRREVLNNSLIESGVPMKLVRVSKKCLKEKYGKVHMGNHLSDVFPSQNGLNKETLYPHCSYNFVFEYAISNVQENQMGLKLNRTHQSRLGI